MAKLSAARGVRGRRDGSEAVERQRVLSHGIEAGDDGAELFEPLSSGLCEKVT